MMENGICVSYERRLLGEKVVSLQKRSFHTKCMDRFERRCYGWENERRRCENWFLIQRTSGNGLSVCWETADGMPEAEQGYVRGQSRK